MSETTNPFAATFELQRQAIEQSRQMLHRNAEIGKQANRIALDSIGSGESVQRTGNDLAHSSVNAYVNAMERTVPGDNVAFENIQDVIEDQFEAVNTVNAETWDGLRDVMEQNTTAYEEFVDQYLEMIDGSCDASLEALSNLEDETVAATEAVSEATSDVVSEATSDVVSE